MSNYWPTHDDFFLLLTKIWTTQVSLNHMQSWYSSCILNLPYFVFTNLSLVFSTQQQSWGQNPMSCAFLHLTQHFTPKTLQNGCIEKEDTLSPSFLYVCHIHSSLLSRGHFNVLWSMPIQALTQYCCSDHLVMSLLLHKPKLAFCQAGSWPLLEAVPCPALS